jgi:hypothetical protein
VTKYEINKFPPSLFKHGRFLREDWTACTDIGRTTPRGTLDKQEYLRIEGLYVDAVATLARTVEPDLLRVHDVEFWHTTSDRLAELGLANVLDGSAAPAEGETAAGVRLDNLVRRCLREVAWLELMVTPKLLVHFGYDMRVIVASSIPLASPLDQIRCSGLFVYDSDAPLPTLESWDHGPDIIL